jgi:hypothetical protein
LCQPGFQTTWYREWTRLAGVKRVVVNLSNTKSDAIVSERLTVHGTPTSSDPSPYFGTSSKVEIGARQTGILALSLSHFSDFKSVELNSVTYADGSSWQPATGEFCIVTLLSRQ